MDLKVLYSMKDPLGLVRVIRPVNSLMVGFAIIVGAIIGGGDSLFDTPVSLLYAFLTGFALSGSAMAINDYYDREIDAINEPNRPLPSGAITPREAYIWSLFLAVVGLVFSYMNSQTHLALASIAWAAFWYYSSRGKKTGLLGNMIVSVSVSLPFIYGGLIVGGNSAVSSLIFSMIAFLTNTGREITKGIVDIEGDKKVGVQTVAVSRGARTAAIASAILYVSAVLSSIIPVYLGVVSNWYIIPVALTDIGLIYLSISIFKDFSRENSRKVKNIVRLLMLVGMLGFLAGSLM